MNGKVKMWNAERGFGFIEPADGPTGTAMVPIAWRDSPFLDDVRLDFRSAGASHIS
jgi:'Cold-shock' DNA-binding domain